MSETAMSDTATKDAPAHGSKQGCCGGGGTPEPRTDASKHAGQGGNGEPLRRAHETPSPTAGACCCGGAATDSHQAAPKDPGVKSK
jgi:hypothetical protein